MDENKETSQNLPEVSARVKKQSEMTKVISRAVETNINELKKSIVRDVVSAFIDVVCTTFDVDSPTSRGRTGNRAGSYVSYNGYYKKESSSLASKYESIEDGFSYNSVIVSSRGAAEYVLSKMRATLNVYGVVKVGDMYDFVNSISSIKLPVDNDAIWRHGWRSLDGAETKRLWSGEYEIVLPFPQEIR